MIFVWLALFFAYLVCGAVIIPQSNLEQSKSAPKDWQYWTAHVLFYLIPASYFLGVDDPSAIILLAGFVLFVTGAALSIWARVSNQHFSPVIEMPPAVITDGAYAVFAHPGYLGMGLMAAGSWLTVGHSLAFVPLAFYAVLLCWRARRESAVLGTS